MGPEGKDHAPGKAGEFTRTLGHTVKVVRVDQGLSRRELGERVGISVSYVSEIENGHKPPSSPVLLRIAEALGMAPSDLLARAEHRAASAQPGAVSRPGDLPAYARLDLTIPAFGTGRLHRPMDSPSALASTDDVRRDACERPEPAERARGWQEARELLDRLSPEDLARVLDLARRLAE
jgi:transcriptional regulator with XRE-family HTH domain